MVERAPSKKRRMKKQRTWKRTRNSFHIESPKVDETCSLAAKDAEKNGLSFDLDSFFCLCQQIANWEWENQRTVPGCTHVPCTTYPEHYKFIKLHWFVRAAIRKAHTNIFSLAVFSYPESKYLLRHNERKRRLQNHKMLFVRFFSFSLFSFSFSILRVQVPDELNHL